MIQNQMGNLKDLDETDYFELTKVWKAEKTPDSLSSFLKSI